MLALLRLIVVGFVVLTVVYVCLSLWSRSVRRRKLNAEWEETRQGDREAFVEAGLTEYDGSLRRKLILGVYVVPTVTIAIIIYLVNYA